MEKSAHLIKSSRKICRIVLKTNVFSNMSNLFKWYIQTYVVHVMTTMSSLLYICTSFWYFQTFFFVYLHTEVHFNDINISMKAYTTKLQNKLLFLALILPSTSSLYNSIEVDIIRWLLAGCEATVAILIRWALGGLNKIEVHPNEKPFQSRWLLCAIFVVYGMSYTCFNLDM